MNTKTRKNTQAPLSLERTGSFALIKEGDWSCGVKEEGEEVTVAYKLTIDVNKKHLDERNFIVNHQTIDKAIQDNASDFSGLSLEIVGDGLLRYIKQACIRENAKLSNAKFTQRLTPDDDGVTAVFRG